MASIFSFKCAKCGQLHEGAPSFGFDAPLQYSELRDAEKAEIAELGADTCRITHPGQTDYFIRVCLEVPIHGYEEPFLWGVWVSLSADNFRRYLDTWDEPDESDCYFGWFCNRLPWYPDTLHLKTNVHPRAGGTRPWAELEPTEHPLARDFCEGISVARAQEIAEDVMHGGSPT